MSAASGIAATGVALVLAFLAVGQPVWEWRLVDATQTEVWSYKLFSVDHVLGNASTNATSTTSYTYYDLPGQPRMSTVFIALGRWFAIGLIAAAASVALAAATLLKKVRGLYAGIAALGACAAILYAGLNLAFALPPAAVDIPGPSGATVTGLGGTLQNPGAWTLSWAALPGWFLLLGIGLALAWTSSELWHIRVPKRAPAPAAVKVAAPAPVRAPAAPPAPVVQVKEGPQEPVIDEVFIIAPSGLLVKHMSRSLLSDKDRDVVGGMISVVSNFVRDAFTEKDGQVQEIQLGEHRFIMYNHNGLVLAVLVGKGDTEPILHRLRHLATLLLDRYGERLTAWSGEPLDGIEDELAVLWEPFFVPPPPAD